MTGFQGHIAKAEFEAWWRHYQGRNDLGQPAYLAALAAWFHVDRRNPNMGGFVEMSGVQISGAVTSGAVAAHRGSYMHQPSSHPPGRAMHHGDGASGWDEP